MEHPVWSVGIHDNEDHVDAALRRLLDGNVVAVGWKDFGISKTLNEKGSEASRKIVANIKAWSNSVNHSWSAPTVFGYLLTQCAAGHVVIARSSDRVRAVGRFRKPTAKERAGARARGAVEIPGTGLFYEFVPNNAKTKKEDRYEHTLFPVDWHELKKPHLHGGKRNIAVHKVKDQRLAAWAREFLSSSGLGGNPVSRRVIGCVNSPCHPGGHGRSRR